MSVIVAFLFAISLWYLSSNHKVTSVKLKATYLKLLPNRGWHGFIPAGGTFVSATGGTFQSDAPGTFVSAMGGTFDSDIPGTFESATGGTFNPLLSRQFYEFWSQFINRSPTATEINRDDFLGISFSHHMKILNKTKDIDTVLFYIHETVMHRWDKYTLRDKLKFKIHETQR